MNEMTGNELVKMMRRAGITSPELAKHLGWSTPWRVYAARRAGSDSIVVIIDRVLERLMSKHHYDRALEDIRGIRNAQNVALVEIEAGISLSQQARRDLVAIAGQAGARIHVYRDGKRSKGRPATTTDTPNHGELPNSGLLDEDNS